MSEPDRSGVVSRRRAIAIGGGAIGALALGGISLSGAQEGQGGGNGERHYRVTVTDLTTGQPFTPPAVAAHGADVEVFAVGEPANEATRQLAENGDLGPLLALVEDSDSIADVAVGDRPLVPEDDPGGTGNPYYATLHVTTDESARFLTFVSMLIATNDGLVGLDTVELPQAVNESRTYYANGYDVGTERNTERFEDLVPPAQSLIQGGDPEGGTAESDPDIATDGVIRPHPGIQGDADLDVGTYGWEEPAGMVQVERLERLETEFTASLSGLDEVPAVETEASGSATFTLDDAGDELRYSVNVSDIEDVTAAHIHCAPEGANGPVGATLFSGKPGTPDGVLAEGAITAPDEDNDCGWETFDALVAALRGDHTYVNVHTEANPAGEIRGQLR